MFLSFQSSVRINVGPNLADADCCVAVCRVSILRED